jgi:hypothetical protein
MTVGAIRSSGMCRWALLAAAVAVGGCGPSSLDPHFDAGPPDTGQPDAWKPDAPTQPDPFVRTSHYLSSNRNVDLLFLVDDSSSMRLSQDNLNRNFPLLMQQLKNQPGGLPNVHIGVISSDMGAGDGSIASCESTIALPRGAGGAPGTTIPPGGKHGILQNTPRGTCTDSGLVPGATFISDIAGSRNYTGDLENVFSCIAALGESGCGFEHQFAAITRALGADGLPPPAENQGFLRPDALLVIVMITNEDDCSAAPGVPLFDTASNTNMASQLGPPQNFRCNEFGHICGGVHPSRFAPNNDVNASVSYTDCTSNDAEGYLLSVRDTVDRLRALKADDGQVMVAAITGPRAPYVVNWREPSFSDTSCNSQGQSCPWPMIAHSCTAADGSFADPAVRIAQLVDDLGPNGRLLSICDGEFGPALANIGNDVVHYVSSPCIMGQVAKRPNTARDDCTVVENATGDTILACADTGNNGRCWQLVPGGLSCVGVSVLVQGGAAGPPDLTVDCQLCVPGTPDPARGCP